MTFTIAKISDPELQAKLQHKIDFKTKPTGALGRLEGLALQIGLIQRSISPALTEPQIVVFAADHGLAAEGVSAYPSSVTVQMVANMRAGGAAVNAFARQMGFAMTLVNAGVASDLIDVPPDPRVSWLDASVGKGTRNAAVEAAMGVVEAQTAMKRGAELVSRLPGNVIVFGEMGIGNTSAAAMLLVRLGGVDLSQAVGRGTGLSDAQLSHKQAVLAGCLALHADAIDPIPALAALGGFEIAMMVGAMLQAASERRVVVVDGFIAGATLLVASGINANVVDYCVFSHESAERGTKAMLQVLGAKPLMDLGLRLGEGTGALLAYPLLQAACGFMAEMATFESAEVSQAI